MGLFSRRSGVAHEAAPGHDAHLPVAAGDGATLRELVRTAFAEHDIEVRVDEDRVVGPNDREFGLHALVRDCLRGADGATWPEVISEQVAAALAPSPALDDVGEVELEAHIATRLLGLSRVLDRSWFPTADRPTDDLIVVPALDLGDEALVLAESTLVARGELDHWRERALLNLHGLVASSPLEASHLKGQHVELDVVRGTSPFTASFTLFLPELLDRFGLAEGPRGVLVVVPSQHQLAFRIVDGTKTTVKAIDDLFAFGILGYRDGVEPISPHVYWVEDGHWIRITDFVGAEPVVTPPTRAADALGMPRR